VKAHKPTFSVKADSLWVKDTGGEERPAIEEIESEAAPGSSKNECFVGVDKTLTRVRICGVSP
jgi:hypothetical protein